MHQTVKKLEKSQVEITITVPPAEYENDLHLAATRLSERVTVKGFRPGKVPYETMKQQVGEAALLEEALSSIVQKNFFAAVQAEKLTTVGMPEVKMEKVAPHNEVIFTATVALLPKVTLPDLEKIKVERKKPEVTEAEIDEVLKNLSNMQRKEVAKTGKSTAADKVVIDLDMFLDSIAVDGGQAKDHQVYLSEDHYIPGLATQLIGVEKDEEKTFSLKFPESHYQKNLAGKDIDFKVKIKDVFSLETPTPDDDFAKALGQKSLADLRDLLKQNLLKEAEQKEDQRLEAAALDELISKASFEEIPDILVLSEKQKMFLELKRDLERNHIAIEDYLRDLKKTEAEMLSDFTAQAERRAKAALVSHQLANEHHIEPSATEIQKEIEVVREYYKDDEVALANLKRPEVIDTIRTALQNRKVVEWLKIKTVRE